MTVIAGVTSAGLWLAFIYCEGPIQSRVCIVQAGSEIDIYVTGNREPCEKRLCEKFAVAKDGIWFTSYESTPEQRAEDLSVAWGRGQDLEVIRPLKAGGAHRYLYEGFELKSVTTITEEAYKAEKEKMKAALTAHSPEKTLGK